MKRTAKSTKSREGCARCKAKKIKCDEARPACSGCLRAGVECPGYSFQYKWSRKHEKSNMTTARVFQGGDAAAVDSSSAHPPPSARNSAPPDDNIDDNISLHTDRGGSGEPSAGRVGGTLPYVHRSSPMQAPPTTSHVSQPTTSTAPVEAPRDQVPFPYNDPMAMGMDLDDFWQFGMPYPDDPMVHNPAMFNPGLAAMPQSIDYQAQAHLIPWLDPPLQRPSSSDLQWGRRAPGFFRKQSSAERAMAPPPGLRPGARSLLGTFYRMSTPSSIAQFSEEHLVQHYFSGVASLFSCFDGPFNPFRTMVQEMRASSKTIHLAVQSMAVAELSNNYLYMAPLGHVKHSQAWRSLQLDLQLYRAGKLPLQNVMVSLLLLGLSSTWHNPSNLGLQYLFVARNLMQNYLRGGSGFSSSSELKNERFFTDALMHWEMLASFVDLQPMCPFPGYGAPNPDIPNEREPELPHPWTGISTEIHFALGEVGRVLRRRRCVATRPAHRDSETNWPEVDERWAASLEQFVYAIVIPDEDAILDYGDDATSKVDLIRTADANRHVTLLEIYMCFPKLLENKIAGGSRFPDCHEESFYPPTDTEQLSHSTLVETCACALAEFILNLIKDVSISSGACRMQPLILVSCASQLRLPTSTQDTEEARHKDVSDSRSFVEERMLALSRKYPQKQILQLLDVINEVWERLDGLKENAHWLDVIHEKRLQTMLG